MAEGEGRKTIKSVLRALFFVMESLRSTIISKAAREHGAPEKQGIGDGMCTKSVLHF